MRKLIIILLLITGLAGLQGQEPFKCNGQYYITQTLAEFDNQVSAISSLTIAPGGSRIDFNEISGTRGKRHLNAMGYRITDNLIYVIDQDTRDLVQVDADGDMRALRRLSELPDNRQYVAGACSPDGKYMVISGNRIELVRFGFFLVERYRENNLLALIDLTDPSYPVRQISMADNRFYIHDFAFDPFTGILYGWDALNEQLVTVDINDGSTEAVGSPNRLVGTMGSIFFDAFGNLYGYGDPLEIVEVVDPNDDGQNTLFSIDKETGAVRKLISDKLASGTDGCACPYTVKMLKTVAPRSTVPCSDVLYTFDISNASAIARGGLQFIDSLPEGMAFSEIIKNPFGGTVSISDDGRILEVQDMTVPLGEDSLIVRVEVGDVEPGLVPNQASLVGLPDSLGALLLSDDPVTVAVDDPTILEIVPLEFDLEIQSSVVCQDDTLVLTAGDLDAEFLWSDGSREPSLEVTQPGYYSLVATTECDTFFDEVEVIFHEPILVDIAASAYQIRLGDSIFLESVVQPPSDYNYKWSGSPINDSYALCRNCENTGARPFTNTRYRLQVTDEETGCQSQAFVNIGVDRNLNIWVPNAFTPNGDGVNDRFFVLGQYPYLISSFEIFNRWGIRVFRTNDIAVNDESAGWPGKAGGELLPPDVFVWKAVFQLPDGSTFVRSGDVNLVR